MLTKGRFCICVIHKRLFQINCHDVRLTSIVPEYANNKNTHYILRTTTFRQNISFLGISAQLLAERNLKLSLCLALLSIHRQAIHLSPSIFIHKRVLFKTFFLSWLVRYLYKRGCTGLSIKEIELL